MNHHAIRRKEFKLMQQKKKNPKAKIQATLDGTVKTLNAPRVFTREGVLHAVTQFIACDDQVSVGKDIKRPITYCVDRHWHFPTNRCSEIALLQ